MPCWRRVSRPDKYEQICTLARWENATRFDTVESNASTQLIIAACALTKPFRPKCIYQERRCESRARTMYEMDATTPMRSGSWHNNWHLVYVGFFLIRDSHNEKKKTKTTYRSIGHTSERILKSIMRISCGCGVDDDDDSIRLLWKTTNLHRLWLCLRIHPAVGRESSILNQMVKCERRVEEILTENVTSPLPEALACSQVCELCAGASMAAGFNFVVSIAHRHTHILTSAYAYWIWHQVHPQNPLPEHRTCECVCVCL